MSSLPEQSPTSALPTPPGKAVRSAATRTSLLFALAVLPVFALAGFTAYAAEQSQPPASAHQQEQLSASSLVTAAGPVRGVGALGRTPSPQSAPPPRPAYGGTPGDYGRGYEGMSPTPGDFWHRESDFRDRNYTIRQGSPPAYATPPQPPVGGGGGRVIDPYDPTLPKPPLPGDSDPAGRVVRPPAPAKVKPSGKGE